MKRKRKKRILTIFFAALWTAFSLFPENAWAEGENGSEIQARLCAVSGETAEKIEFGQFTVLEFTLPRNLEVKAELFLPNLDRSLGCLYAVSFQEHMRNQGSLGAPDYEWKRKMEEEEIQGELETFSISGFYEKTSRISGIGSSDESISNYLIWKGQYVPVDEAYPRYVKPGSYEIRITPLDSSFASQAVSVPLVIRGSGEMESLSQEDVRTVLEREKTYFPREHMHVLDVWMEPQNCRVSLKTGELLWQEQDIAAEEGGMIPFVRYHRNGKYYPDQGLNLAGLGDLWTHSYSYFADIYRMDVIVYLPGGQVLNFGKEYRRGWQNYDDDRYRLGETEDGFVLQIPEGGEVFFNSEGRPVRIARADGSELHLAYAGGRLYRVSSDTERLSFSYKGDRLTKVSNDRGEKIQFFYEDGSKEVAEVSREDARSRYQYDDHHQLLKVLDETGNPRMEAVYGTYSNITGRAKAEFLRLPEENFSCTFAYDESGKRNICQVKDGNTLVMTYKENYGAEYQNCSWMLYDKQGSLLRSSEASGKTDVY